MIQNLKPAGRKLGARLSALGIVLAGILLGQIILYGPCLVGRKILLPLDLLAGRAILFPMTPEAQRIRTAIKNPFLGDLIYLLEPERRFAVSELRAGRLPLWAPYMFAGVPLLWPKFSPFLALESCTDSPVVLAWAQLFAASVAGLGAYFYFRRALGVGFWPATFCAWCYPLTGFFIFWQGFPTGQSVYWFPWLLLAVDRTARGKTRFGPAWLSLATCLVLVSGHLDVAVQVLLVSGIYGLWCWYDAFAGLKLSGQSRRAFISLAAGWMLGCLLAAPQIVTVLEYARTGTRMALREEGREERPPVGLSALPLAVVPEMYGRMDRGHVFLSQGNQTESAAAAYSGLLATLFVAPLAWCSGRHRSAIVFWVAAWLLGLSWCLDLPGVVQVLRLPGLNMMSHNRLVFVSCFATLVMAAIGLEVLFRHEVKLSWRGWWVPPLVVSALLLWCCYRAFVPPEPLATQLYQTVSQAQRIGWWISDIKGLQQARSSFCQAYAISAGLCALALSGWLTLFSSSCHARLAPVVASFLLIDLVWFGCGRSVQCDPALYFPRIPVLDQVAGSLPGRVMGYRCLPATLAAMYGLCDVRGYDGVDPAQLVELVETTTEPGPAPKYARTQFLAPKLTYTPDGGIRVSPLLDMLGVRYIVFRGTPAPGVRPAFVANDYWAVVNSNALPRVFVPRRVEEAADHDERLKKLASAEFNPREVAYVESPLRLQGFTQGSAEIVHETPGRIKLAVQMETPGLVVLADRWDPGWRAYLNGQRVPILRTNHAVRGVAVPAGTAVLEFHYLPGGFILGLWLCGLALMSLLIWLGMVAWKHRGAHPHQA